MNFNFFSFFKKNPSKLIVPDSILIKRIKSLSKYSNIKVFSHIDIYFHTKKETIDLMLFDDTRGLYIFEIKKWSFDDLKNATIEKAQNQEHASNTLAFDKTHDLIRRKFNEINHHDGPAIYNYLLMENLRSEEYEHLDDSFKELLPQEKIIFSDSATSDIFKKLEAANLYGVKTAQTDVLETLFTQYTKIDTSGHLTFCSQKEQDFLNLTLSSYLSLDATVQEDKTSLLLLKAIIELFTQKSQKVIYIKPTRLAKDLAYKKFLEIIEHGIIEFDINALQLLTPEELINKHLSKLKKEPISTLADIDPKLYSKPFDIADLIICDDADQLDEEFVQYIHNIQKNKKAIFVNYHQDIAHKHDLESAIHKTKIKFFQTLPLAKAMSLINTLLKEYEPNEIMVVSNMENREKLKEDLEHFIEERTLEIDSSKTLPEHNLSDLKLATFEDIFELHTKNIILLDLCDYNQKQIEYAFNLATENFFILYDENCEIIETLKEKYESTKE